MVKLYTSIGRTTCPSRDDVPSKDVDRGVAMHRSSCLFTYRRASVCFNTDNSLLVVANSLRMNCS